MTAVLQGMPRKYMHYDFIEKDVSAYEKSRYIDKWWRLSGT